MNSLGFLETLWQDLRYGARLLRRNPDLRGGRDPDARARHGREYRDLPARGRRAPSRAAGRSSRAAGRSPHRQGAERPDGIVHGALADAVVSALPEDPRRAAGVHRLHRLGLRHRSISRKAARSGRPQALWVSGNFFSALGVRPAAGRLLAPSDDVKGCGAPGVVLGHAFWQREYGGDPSVVGRALLLDGHRSTSSACRAQEFYGVDVGRAFDVAVPICAEPIVRGARSGLAQADIWFLGRHRPSQAGRDAWSRRRRRSRRCRRAFSRATVSPRYTRRTRRTTSRWCSARARPPARSLRPAAQLRRLAEHPSRRHRSGAADCLREPREPDAGARDGARARSRRPSRDRRVAPADRPADAVGEPADRRRWRRGRRRCRAGVQPLSGRLPQHERQPALRRAHVGLAGLRVHGRRRGGGVPALRPDARDPRHADAAGRRDEDGKPRDDRRARALRHAARAGRASGGAVAGAARGRPAVLAQPEKPDVDGSRASGRTVS